MARRTARCCETFACSNSKPLDQGSSGEFAVAQEFEDGDAGGMRECLEDVGFEPAEGILHTGNISIYEY